MVDAGDHNCIDQFGYVWLWQFAGIQQVQYGGEWNGPNHLHQIVAPNLDTVFAGVG
jgi:hypothetical protein